MPLPFFSNAKAARMGDDEPQYRMNKTPIGHLYKNTGRRNKFVVTANAAEVLAVLNDVYRVGVINSFNDERDRDSIATTVQITFDKQPHSPRFSTRYGYTPAPEFVPDSEDGYLSLHPMTPNRTSQVLKHYAKKKRPVISLEELIAIVHSTRGTRLANSLGIANW